jgi:uncharacterized protein
VRQVFGDAFYWIALTDPGDAWHARARAVGQTLGPVRIVTTEPVLAELLNHFSGAGSYWRGRALAMVDTVRQSPGVEVLRCDPDNTFERALSLYASRPDKAYSFVDCVSMLAMRDLEIYEVLTHDAHFAQEGFVLLLG